MKINNLRGELTDNSAKKEALHTFLLRRTRAACFAVWVKVISKLSVAFELIHRLGLMTLLALHLFFV